MHEVGELHVSVFFLEVEKNSLKSDIRYDSRDKDNGTKVSSSLLLLPSSHSM